MKSHSKVNMIFYDIKNLHFNKVEVEKLLPKLKKRFSINIPRDKFLLLKDLNMSRPKEPEKLLGIIYKFI